ncbi:vacuolar h+-atpase assembly protein [Colletotrichum musicola]|uniref:Vacuolar h+-atpase assembly protein n=1 Tax=Colletotrichum musicola TaxID=2175873 RepID=A0A8H6NNV6_9PEZI|nr:vacuolar h+-atpase assembly protein [Colletotrichum musicola]
MVRLTMTVSIVEGLQKLAEARSAEDEEKMTKSKESTAESSSEPSLDDPAVGKPISHGQILELWRKLQRDGVAGFPLEGLLQSAQVYNPPPPPKPEPSEEYKALMARLRRDEEEKSYQRMLKQPSRLEAFAQQFPNASAQAAVFAEVNRPIRESDNGDDVATYDDVQKQLMVILNFLLSVIGVGATIWIAARWWSLTARIFLTMGGAIVVLIAEVAVYSGYVWRLTESKKTHKEPPEVREVVQTWMVGQDEKLAARQAAVLLDPKTEDTGAGIRQRVGRTS